MPPSTALRRPGTSLYDRIGMYDMTTDDVYFGFLAGQRFSAPVPWASWQL